MVAVYLALVVCLPLALALPDGLALTPPMGWNSWTSFGCGVTAADLLDTATFFTTSGLAAAGYTYINTDDCWMGPRNSTTGKPTPNLSKFPEGIAGLVSALHAKGFKFGIYSAASSVVCSGNVGSLYHEVIDAQTYAEWDVDYVKYDNCGEYSLGLARFTVFADAVAATGRPMVISTEPFTLVPNPMHADFAHLWRTGFDISANWGTIINRADNNARWQPFAGPGHWNDPDMLQCGNGDLTDAECRTHFSLWSISKAPLMLGTNVQKLTPTQLAILGNPEVIAVNQDPAGVQARKLAVDGVLVPGFAGLAPCWLANVNTVTPSGPGYNGVTPAGLKWSAKPVNASANSFTLVNSASGRCLGLRTYTSSALIPVLVPCAPVSQDPTQEWAFPPTAVGTVGTITALLSVPSGQALAVANSTLFSAVHGKDEAELPDANYGIQTLLLVPYAPEPPCTNRGCQDYDPTQMWYYSPRQGTIALANAEGNGYRCYEGPCYQLTSHLPSSDTLCLSSVASISNDPLNPTGAGTADVWGGPLANGDYAFALVNRGASTQEIEVQWSMLEVPAYGPTTAACVKELYTGATLNATGSATFSVASHDTAMLRVTFNSACK